MKKAMGKRQKEKSEMTRQELSDAMLRLFLEKGYQETTIQDIAVTAGYSVGSFYRHWSSKQQAFMEVWDAFVSAFIRDSVFNALQLQDIERVIDYLIMRSNAFADLEMAQKLYATSQLLSIGYEYQSVADWTLRYTNMLIDFLRRATGVQDEHRLRATARVMHILLDTHAMRYIAQQEHNKSIDTETVRDCLLVIVGTLR